MSVADIERAAQFVVDADGHKKAVVLDFAVWEELTSRLAQLDATLVPPRANTAPTAWDDLMRLGEEIGRGWQSPLSSVELLSEMRRSGSILITLDHEQLHRVANVLATQTPADGLKTL